MGREIDLLAHYPRTKRRVDERGHQKTEADRAIARKFGEDFFDGDRRHGYGGYHYHPRFWQPTIPDFRDHFDLTDRSSLLDVGCAKGFFLHDLGSGVPGIRVAGLDVSGYAVSRAIDDVKPFLLVGDASALPFPDDSFDVVVSINTVHNLDRNGCARALGEIERVGRRSFIMVDAYRNEVERERMEDWNLTARTIMSVEEWIAFFGEIGYTGDYYWFVP